MATVATIPTVLVAQPEKYKTIKDFVGAAKAEARQAGVRRRRHRQRDAHGVRALPLRRRHREVLNVHTKGVGEALTEVVSGRADCYFALVFQAKKIVDAGKVDRARHQLAQAQRADAGHRRRSEEQGFQNASYNFWVGALVPAKTPRAIVDKLHDDITALVESPEVSEQIRSSAATRCRCR